MPGTPEQGVRCPSPRLWRMRCAEVIASGGVLARALVGELAALSRSARRRASPVAGQAASVASPVNASHSEA